MRRFFLKATFILSALFVFLSLTAGTSYSYFNRRNEIIFKKAYDNYSRGMYKPAADQFRLYGVKGSLLKDYALYYQGLSLFKLKEYRDAGRVFLNLASLYPKFVFYKNAVFYLALCEEKNGFYLSEISHLRYIAGHSKKSAVRSYAMFKIYKAYIKLKNRRLAERFLLRIYTDYPVFSKSHNINFSEASLSEPQKIKRGLNLYYDSYYTESIGLLKNISAKSKKARFIILKDLMKLKSPLFLKQADECLRAHKAQSCYRYYGVRKLSVLELKARYYYYILHNSGKAGLLLDKIAGRYGFLSDREMLIYRQIVWNAVLNDLKRGNTAFAADKLKSFLAVSDKVDGENAKFLFWYGETLEKLGYRRRASFYFNIIKGSRFLRYSYYGIMSAIMINKIDGMKGASAKNLNVGYIGSHARAKSKITDYKYIKPYLNFLAFKRFKAFLSLKLYSLSNVEMQRFYPAIRNKKAGAAFAYMLYKNREYGAAVGLASNMIYNYKYKYLLLDGNFLKILYPRPYYASVLKYSSRYGIPVNLIYGIMRQESLYNPACYSSASAIGLMQIIPSTGYYIAKRTRCYNFNPSMLYRKNINISFGSYYLKTLLSQFYNKKYLAIASYNAGPGAVAYWRNYLLKNYKMPLFIELIPFNQTRNYVKRVLANYYVYNSLY